MKPILLFVVNDSWFFVSHRLPIAVAAIEDGYEVHVLAKEDETSRIIEDAGCHFLPWNLQPRGKTIFAEIRAFKEVYKNIRRIQPNIIHLVTIKSVIYGGLASKLAGMKNVVIAVAGMGSMFDKDHPIIGKLQPIIRRLYKFSTSHPNNVFIFQNKTDKSTFVKLFNLEERSTRLFHGSGVDLDLFLTDGHEKSAVKVIMGARLIEDKGVYEFIEAARIVKSKRPDVIFQIAGGALAKGHPGSVSLEELDKVNSNFEVEVLGHVNDMVPLLLSASIAVLPSYYNEGLPKFLAEAAASGLPAVTTDHPGCRDAVEDGATGLLVPIKNSKLLASALLTLIDNEQLRQSMGERARERAESYFDVEVIVQSHLNIYKGLINAQR